MCFSGRGDGWAVERRRLYGLSLADKQRLVREEVQKEIDPYDHGVEFFE